MVLFVPNKNLEIFLKFLLSVKIILLIFINFACSYYLIIKEPVARTFLSYFLIRLEFDTFFNDNLIKKKFDTIK
jgi:hypothetical protein